MLNGRNRGHCFLIFLSPRAKLLAEHTFCWVLHFVPQQQRLLLEFDFLSRIVCAKNTWKSSATATKEIAKEELSFLQETARNCSCQKIKT